MTLPGTKASDNGRQPGQKFEQKEEWLRNLIKSILVEWGTRDGEHIKGPDPFQSDTCAFPQPSVEEDEEEEKTWLGWQALSDTANLLITWKLEGAHAKKRD